MDVDFVAKIAAVIVVGLMWMLFGYNLLAWVAEKAFRRDRTHEPEKLLKVTGAILLGYLCIIGGFVMFAAAVNITPPDPIKLIILDIDGVLNHNKAPKRLNVSHLYDPACVDRLNTLIAEHKAKVVVCSAWRIGQTVESMQGILDSIGVKGQVIGLTPWYQGYHTRDDEITAWLSNYDSLSKTKSIVLLDDDTSERFGKIQVKPSWNTFGFRNVHAAEADAILTKGLPENFDIGKVSICKSEASNETTFGGHYIQKELLNE